QLVVLGESPVADALMALAAPLGFRIATTLGDCAERDTWVVAAAMSSDEDHPAVRDALSRGAEYVAMVASRRRTDALLAELRADGASDAKLGALKAPAGLDIGAATAAEIALSVLAEIVQIRRTR